jgi:signal transduction histidine kinase
VLPFPLPPSYPLPFIRNFQLLVQGRELQQAKLEAQRALSTKTEFFARVSYEFRTPLNIILVGMGKISEARIGVVEPWAARRVLCIDLASPLLSGRRLGGGRKRVWNARSRPSLLTSVGPPDSLFSLLSPWLSPFVGICRGN